MATKVKVKSEISDIKKSKVKKERIENKIEVKNLSAMDKLMSSSKNEIRSFKRGEQIEGVITYLSRSLILLDIGSKSDGVVTDKELKGSSDLISTFKEGEKIKAFVKYPENDMGNAVLSLQGALEDSRWSTFEKWMDQDVEVDVVGLEVNKGGMIVSLDGDVRGFVPTSQFGEKYLGKMIVLLNKSFKVKVIEVDREQNRLIFSEKLISDAMGLAKKGVALDRIKEGEEFDGVVSGIMPFGVFVTVTVPVRDETGKDTTEKAKVEGLVHISEISWEKVTDPNTMFKVGDELHVQVIGVDLKSSKLNLSIKRLDNDPWKNIDREYAVGTKHEGEVVRVAPYGVLVNFNRGIDGLIHVSKQPADREFKVGDKVSVYVEMLDTKNRRMSLGVVLTEVPVAYR